MISERDRMVKSAEIVVVDDDQNYLKLLSYILQNEGYEVRLYDRSDQALIGIREKTPSLVLLDKSMPEMDGFEICRALKADQITRDIPIIFITANSDQESFLSGLKEGAVDYVKKPFQKEELLARVRTHISLFQLQRELIEKNETLENEIIKRKQFEVALEKRLIALTQPLESSLKINFEELFNLAEIQQLQDQFATAFGISSVIANPNGAFITNPSSFCCLCRNVLLNSDKGLKNCKYGWKLNNQNWSGGSAGKTCVIGDLFEADVPIMVGNQHVATWSIGQVRRKNDCDKELKKYARAIGADESEFLNAWHEIPVMEPDQFQRIKEVISSVAGKLSEMAYQSIQQAQIINDRMQAETAMRQSEEKLRSIFESSPTGKYIFELHEDDKLIFMGANPSADRILGIDHRELIGKTLQDAFPIFADSPQSAMYVAIAKGKTGTQTFEIDFLKTRLKGVFQVTVFKTGANAIVVDFYDISEKKRRETELREQEERFRNLFENAGVGISMTGIDGKISINKTFRQLLGYSEEEFQNKNWNEITHPSDLNMSAESVDKLLKGKEKCIRFEKRYLHKNGTSIWADVSVALQRDISNQPLYFITSINDISLQKQSAIALRDSEEMFRKLAESTSIAILIYQEEHWVYSNPTGQQLTGYELDELYQFKTWEIVAPEFQELIKKRSKERLMGKGNSEGYEVQIIRKDGQYRWIYLIGSLINYKGKPAGIISALDVTEKKMIEDQLRQSEAFYRSIFENNYAVMLLIDPTDSSILDANEAAVNFYGYSPAQITQMKISQINTISRKDLLIKMKEVVEKDRVHFEFKHRLADHSLRDVEVYTTKVRFNQRDALFSIIHDISDRKIAEVALLRANQTLEAFFSQSLDGFFFMMLDRPIDWKNCTDQEKLLNYTFSHQRPTRVNEALLSQYGSSIEEFRKLTPNNLFAHNIAQAKSDWTNLFNNGQLHCEKEERKMNGQTMYIEGDYTCLYDTAGRIIGHFGIQRDITESKKYLETIKNERSLLRTMIDNLPATIYVKDTALRKIVANKADIELIGLTSEAEVLGKTDLEIFPSEIGQRGYNDDLRVIETGEPILNREETFVDLDGNLRCLLTTKVPLTDGQGIRIGLVGIGRDITEQKIANETILKLSKGIEQNPASIVITDLDGTIEYVNPKFSEITGYTSEEAKGQNPRILKSGETKQQEYQQLWDCIAQGEVWRGEFHNRKKNGELYWEYAVITSIKNEMGLITNYIAIKEDITQRKILEADLILAKEKAEESDRFKSAFLANMSHEIRTPLNSIIGFSKLIADSDYDPDYKAEFLQHIIENGNNLLGIIEDILDISKIESGDIVLNYSDISISDLLNDLISQNQIRASEKGLQLRNAGEGFSSIQNLCIYTDKIRLIQIFNNLLSNAMKFTTEGSICLGYSLKDDQVEFFVQDTGMGIPAEFHEKIFDRFRQVEVSNTRNFGGNGLGLAISKNLVEMMGGKIWLKSTPGEGSTFYFTLPNSKNIS